VQCPKLAPKSYGTQQYYSVSAFKLIDAGGKETFIRYHIVPIAGIDTYDAEALKTKDENYLQMEIVERVKSTPVGFKILAQVAEEGDVMDDATVHWPETRKVVELGLI
jgi:catalase